MGQTVRQAMAYLHTWLGLVLGFVLMACFFFGALSVFDREIDRWSIPETRATAAPLRAVDAMLPGLVAGVRPDPHSMEHAADEVIGPLPPANSLALSDLYIGTNHRDPMLRVFGSFDLPNRPRSAAEDHAHVHGSATLDPVTGKRLPAGLEDRLALGTRFFYPLHFSLHLEWQNLGIWIVGLAGMAMLAALVSGVVMHRRIFREFFTFRPHKARLRSTLDLHNMTGVLALPFLFVITFSGLLIFAETYLPANKGLMLPFVKAQKELEKTRTGLPDKPAGQPSALASVDAMMAAARVRWAAQGVPGEVGSVSIAHVGDANAYVAVERDQVDRVATAETLYFKGSTGELVYEKPPAGAVSATSGFLTGLHFQFFRHWGLRWLLFAGGLVGCACIATGFLFFVEKRKRAHAASGQAGSRIVDALAVTIRASALRQLSGSPAVPQWNAGVGARVLAHPVRGTAPALYPCCPRLRLAKLWPLWREVLRDLQRQRSRHARPSAAWSKASAYCPNSPAVGAARTAPKRPRFALTLIGLTNYNSVVVMAELCPTHKV